MTLLELAKLAPKTRIEARVFSLGEWETVVDYRENQSFDEIPNVWRNSEIMRIENKGYFLKVYLFD